MAVKQEIVTLLEVGKLE